MVQRFDKIFAFMKTPLVVVDFDKTIIPFDSFRRYLFIWLRYHPFKLIYYITLRKLRLVSNFWFKKRVLKLIQIDSRQRTIDLNYVKYLIPRRDVNLLHECRKIAGSNGRILILSASPHSYISLVGDSLNMMAQGSYFDSSDKFIHLYGPGKVEHLQNNYPKSEYDYCYAVSDSLSDFEFLKLFKDSKIL
jgi:phosphoserine phosphatase